MLFKRNNRIGDTSCVEWKFIFSCFRNIFAHPLLLQWNGFGDLCWNKDVFVCKWKCILLVNEKIFAWPLARSVWPPALSLGSARPQQSAAGGTRRQKKKRRRREKKRKKKKTWKQTVELDQSDFPNFRELSVQALGVRRRLREKVFGTLRSFLSGGREVLQDNRKLVVLKLKL